VRECVCLCVRVCACVFHPLSVSPFVCFTHVCFPPLASINNYFEHIFHRVGGESTRTLCECRAEGQCRTECVGSSLQLKGGQTKTTNRGQASAAPKTTCAINGVRFAGSTPTVHK
jgi:hypothetical protein